MSVTCSRYWRAWRRWWCGGGFRWIYAAVSALFVVNLWYPFAVYNYSWKFYNPTWKLTTFLLPADISLDVREHRDDRHVAEEDVVVVRGRGLCRPRGSWLSLDRTRRRRRDCRATTLRCFPSQPSAPAVAAGSSGPVSRPARRTLRRTVATEAGDGGTGDTKVVDTETDDTETVDTETVDAVDTETVDTEAVDTDAVDTGGSDTGAGRGDTTPRWLRLFRSAVAPIAAERPTHPGRWLRLLPLGLVIVSCVFSLVILRSETTPANNLNDSAFHLEIGAVGRPSDRRRESTARRLVPEPHARVIVLSPLSEPAVHAHAYAARITGLGDTTTYLWLLYLMLALWPISVYLGARLLSLERWPAAARRWSRRSS